MEETIDSVGETVEETLQTLQTEHAEKMNLLTEYLQDAVPGLISFALSVIGAVVVYIIGGRIIKICRKLLRKMLERRNVDEGVMQFLDAITKYAGYFILILIILGFFGVTTASVVAVLGSAGLTLGLALQGSLSNFAGGVLLLVLKPFVVGDYVIEASNGNEGFVQEISIFYTTLLTGAEHTIVIPNGTLLNNSITNLTKSGRRRLDVMVDIAYSADLKRAKEVLLRVAERSTLRLPDQPMVLVKELADSCVRLDVRVWTKPLEYWDEMYELNEQIKIELDAAGIEIAFPQMDVHIR